MTVTPPPATTDVTPELSLLAVAVAVLRGRKTIARAAFAIFGLVVGVTLVLPRAHSSTAMFLPNATHGAVSQLSGLAAQFGLALPLEEGQTPDFYVALIESRGILGQLVDSKYQFTRLTGLPFLRKPQQVSGNLIEVFRLDEGGDTAKARDLAIEELKRRVIAVQAGRRTGIVTVRATTRWAPLSQLIAQRVLDLVTAYNQSTRQSQVAAERRFAESRLREVVREQEERENRLQTFLQRNRDFQNAPHLVFQHEALNRDVELLRQVVLGLRQSAEQARIEEVRNTPVITLVQRPELPARPDRRHLLLKGLIALVVGSIVGLTIVLARRTLDTEPRPAERVDLVLAWNDMQASVRRMIGPRRGGK